MSEIIVKISAPELDISEQWNDLVGRAAVNVFMNPVALHAAAVTKFSQIQVLTAWDEGTLPAKLVGIWSFAKARRVPLAPHFLACPPYEYAFVSTPVIDSQRIAEVIAAFLDAIAREPSLPNVLRLKLLDADAEAYAPLREALDARGCAVTELTEYLRPFASRQAGRKQSGSTRKKLRQDWNRLSALGPVDIVNEREHAAVVATFETFLAMEAASWKGAQGTALLCDEVDARFVRRLIGDLAAHGSASVALLRVDGKPIAAQVLLYCGTMAYTWKTAFDGDFAKYSPGVLLIDKLTEQLFATPGIEAIESCSPDGSFMNGLWEGRRATVDLLLHVNKRRSLPFLLASAGEHGFLQLRALRDRLRSASAWRKRRAVAASKPVAGLPPSPSHGEREEEPSPTALPTRETGDVRRAP